MSRASRIYEYTSYKTFLRDQIAERNRRGIMRDLAAQAGCDRTYLSQVLAGKAQLTPDHVVNLADAFGLGSDEADFFLLLLLAERASQPAARRRFEARSAKLRERNLALSRRILKGDAPRELDEAAKVRYYSHWRYGAVHILTSISQFQEPARIARELRLGAAETSATLDSLVEMGLVRRQGARFVHASASLHIPSGSPLVEINHLNWRLRAMERIPRGDGLHYSTAFSVSAADVPALKARLLEFIGAQRDLVHASGSETALAFCCDLFPV